MDKIGHLDKNEPHFKGDKLEPVSQSSCVGKALGKDIDHNVKCFVCRKMLRNPQLVLCCQSMFCLDCTYIIIPDEGKHSEPKCPSCKQRFLPISNEMLQIFYQKMSFTCPYCKKFTSSFENVQNSHWLTCPYFPLSCTNKCGEQLQRQHIEAHIEKECLLTQIDCGLKSKIGCQFRSSRAQMFTHLVNEHVVPDTLQNALHIAWEWHANYNKYSYLEDDLANSIPKEPGYECEIAEFVPDAFQTVCPICMAVLRQPYATSCCGKSFCLFCIKSIKDNNKPCPLCNSMKYTMSFNKGLQQSLIQLQVFCTNKEDANGCQWKGELLQLDNHLNLKPKPGDEMKGCKFTKIECKYCSEMFKRSELKKHQLQCTSGRLLTVMCGSIISPCMRGVKLIHQSGQGIGVARMYIMHLAYLVNNECYKSR